MPALSTRCPYCFGRMDVTALTCRQCHTRVESTFETSPLMALTPGQQALAVKFILVSGNLKDLAAQEGVSYPTIRGRIDRLMEVLKTGRTDQADRRSAVLDAVEAGTITAEDAAGLLKDTKK